MSGTAKLEQKNVAKMYEKMGFTSLVSFSRMPVIRNVVNAGYMIFAYGIRPYLPKKKEHK